MTPLSGTDEEPDPQLSTPMRSGHDECETDDDGFVTADEDGEDVGSPSVVAKRDFAREKERPKAGSGAQPKREAVVDATEAVGGDQPADQGGGGAPQPADLIGGGGTHTSAVGGGAGLKGLMGRLRL